jgi:Flp pilus assembly pilin Flp
MFAKLWKDEAGVISVEYLFLVTIVGLGLVVGFANLEGAINVEYTELSNAILALSQGYYVSTQSGCKAWKQGSHATDTPGRAAFGQTPTGEAPAPTTSNANQAFCGV